MKITTVGIDLAKNVFQVHAVDERGRAVLRKQLRRDQMTAFFANLPPCLIGMEACASAHHWARTLQKFGHTVRLMAPQFVKPYVKTNKNDVADAEAICEAVGRPNMRFVPIKSFEQQAVLSRSARRLPRRSGEPPAWDVRSSGATGAANGCFFIAGDRCHSGLESLIRTCPKAYIAKLVRWRKCWVARPSQHLLVPLRRTAFCPPFSSRSWCS